MTFRRHLMRVLLVVLSLALFGSSANAESSLPPCSDASGVVWNDCFGTVTYASGNKYVGEFKDGKGNGQGTFTYASGDKYVGEWRDWKKHGQGTYTYPDGGEYVGEWKDDKKHGRGTYTFPNGDEYEGDFKNGEWGRQGTRLYADGRLYGGEVINGIPNGFGVYVFPDGTEHEGWFRDGKRHGQGTTTYPDGSKYVGEYRDGKVNGQGTFTYASGDKYVGEWRDWKKHGQGTTTYPDGTKYVGEWRDGESHGQGTETYGDGSEYVGEFKNGIPNGPGTMTSVGGKVQRGNWSDGKLEHNYGELDGKALFCPMRCEPSTPTVTGPYGEVIKITCLQPSDTKDTNVYITFGSRSRVSWINRGGKDKLVPKTIIPPKLMSETFSGYRTDLDTIYMSKKRNSWTINRKSLKARHESMPWYEISGTCRLIEASEVEGALERELSPHLERSRQREQERNERAVRENKL